MQYSKNAGHLSHFAGRGTSDENAGLSLRMRDGWHLWLRGDLYLAYAHSQMNPQTCTKCDANRTSRLTSSPDFWFCDPVTPPPMPRGELYLAYVHSQTNPQTCIKCGANRSSRLTASQDFWICDPLKRPECQILCQSVQRFGSFSWICAKLVRLLATGRAVSHKNAPKNNIYTSKIIIPARTCRHQRH